MRFKLRIVRLNDNRMMTVGVVDYLRQKDSKFSYNTGNSVCYYAVNSEKNPGGGN